GKIYVHPAVIEAYLDGRIGGALIEAAEDGGTGLGPPTPAEEAAVVRLLGGRRAGKAGARRLQDGRRRRGRAPRHRLPSVRDRTPTPPAAIDPTGSRRPLTGPGGCTMYDETRKDLDPKIAADPDGTALENEEHGHEAIGAGAGALGGAAVGMAVGGPVGAVVGGGIGAVAGAVAGEATEGDDEAGAGAGALGGAAAGAAVGGMVAGPPGAVVGAGGGAGAGAGTGDQAAEEVEEESSTPVATYTNDRS